MSKTEPGKEKDFWDKIVAWAKFMGGLGAVIGAILIPWILQSQSEKNQKVQVYAEIMSQREAGDTEIRAKMFDSLLSEYLNISSDTKNNNKQLSNNRIRASNENEDQIKAYKEKIVFLNILMENFQEYFNARPLFEDLYEKINKLSDNDPDSDDPDSPENLKKKLIKLSKRNASKQVSMLSRLGLMFDNIYVNVNCISDVIPLFKIDQRPYTGKCERNIEETIEAIGDLNNDCSRVKDNCEWWNHPDNITLTKNRYSIFKKKAKERKFHAIKIGVKKISYPDVEVEVNLYGYKLNNDKPFMDPQFKRPISFSVSYFDMPYMDNTRIYEGERFTLVLKAICTKDHLEEDECFIYIDEIDSLNKKKKEIDNLNNRIREIEKAIDKEDVSNNEKKKLEKAKKDTEDRKKDLGIELENILDPPSPYAVFQVVTFKEEFMSLRDRPLFEEMLNKLHAN